MDHGGIAPGRLPEKGRVPVRCGQQQVVFFQEFARRRRCRGLEYGPADHAARAPWDRGLKIIAEAIDLDRIDGPRRIDRA